MRLLCFLPPGADAAVYSQWSDALHPDVEVRPVPWTAPDEEPDPVLGRDWSSRIDGVAEEVLDLLDRPFALFGYGSAGLLAFDVAQTVRERFGLSPSHFFVADSSPPEAVGDAQRPAVGEAIRHEASTCRPRRPLDCPLTALASTGGERFGRDAMQGWQQWTQAGFRLQLLQDGLSVHLESPARLLQVLRQDLASAIAE
jgi:surfactin synthase thioesterase subunit